MHAPHHPRSRAGSAQVRARGGCFFAAASASLARNDHMSSSAETCLPAARDDPLRRPREPARQAPRERRLGHPLRFARPRHVFRPRCGVKLALRGLLGPGLCGLRALRPGALLPRARSSRALRPWARRPVAVGRTPPSRCRRSEPRRRGRAARRRRSWTPGSRTPRVSARATQRSALPPGRVRAHSFGGTQAQALRTRPRRPGPPVSPAANEPPPVRSGPRSCRRRSTRRREPGSRRGRAAARVPAPMWPPKARPHGPVLQVRAPDPSSSRRSAPASSAGSARTPCSAARTSASSFAARSSAACARSMWFASSPRKRAISALSSSLLSAAGAGAAWSSSTRAVAAASAAVRVAISARTASPPAFASLRLVSSSVAAAPDHLPSSRAARPAPRAHRGPIPPTRRAAQRQTHAVARPRAAP